jgi:phosphoribosyl 1,2-cyclic phosphate phosphodiesterase
LSGFSVTLLGTGGSAGSPQIGGADGAGDWGELDPAEPRNRRMRASIVISTADGRHLLVDTGPEMRLQLTAHKIPLVHALFYTHAHADHIAGLDDVRILNRLLGAPMPSYATAETFVDLERRFDYAFRPWSGTFFSRPALEPHVIQPGQSFDLLGMTIQTFEQDHGFSKSLGLRMRDFAYCTDVMRLEDAALARLENLAVLVIDCYTRESEHPTHANLEQVLAWAARLKPKRMILTHMGPNMDYGWLRKNLPPGIEPGYDGLALDIA